MKRQEHFQPENVVSAYKRALALKGPSIFPGASILILRRGAPFSDKTGYDLERGAQRPCAEPACCAKRDCAERRHGTMQGRIQDLVNEGGGKRPFVGGTEVCLHGLLPEVFTHTHTHVHTHTHTTPESMFAKADTLLPRPLAQLTRTQTRREIPAVSECV